MLFHVPSTTTVKILRLEFIKVKSWWHKFSSQVPLNMNFYKSSCLAPLYGSRLLAPPSSEAFGSFEMCSDDTLCKLIVLKHAERQFTVITIQYIQYRKYISEYTTKYSFVLFKKKKPLLKGGCKEFR